MIRKANENDILPVAALYERELDYEEKHQKYTSWQRGIYPTADTARAGVKKGTLYVLEEDGEIVASVILDSRQPPEYRNVDWDIDVKYDQVLVVHTLCVDPDHASSGAGTKMLDFTKELAREGGYRTIRLNTRSTNTPAMKFYEKNGFSVAASKEILLNGQIKCDSHLFLYYNIKKS